MPNSVYVQIANFFFILAAVFNDILLVRYALVVANGLLVIAAALGWPLWPNYISDAEIAVDSLIWAAVAFVLHLWALIHLVLDQRSGARFEDESNESLYQFFRKRSGMGRRDFNLILSKGKWTRIDNSGVRLNADKELFLIVEGQVDCAIENLHRRVSEEDGVSRRRHSDGDISSHGPTTQLSAKRNSTKVRLDSGEMFDLKLANVFDVPVGFLSTSFEASTASKNTLLFSWDFESLLEMKRTAPPLVIQGWRNMIAYCVADVAHRPFLSEYEKSLLIRDSRHMDFRIPEVEPKPKRVTFKEYMIWIIKSMDPRPLPGLRRTAVPELSIETAASVYGSMMVEKV